MNDSTLILVIGLSGVGKTTFCNYLSEISNFGVLNSGEALRNDLALKNINVQNKIETGDVFLKHFSEEHLYKIIYDSAIKANANIIDGIRLRSTLKNFLIYNKNIVVIYIEVLESLRLERFLNRLVQDKINKEQAEVIISKKDSYIEELTSMKKYANFIVDNNHSDLFLQAKKIWEFICTNKSENTIIHSKR